MSVLTTEHPAWQSAGPAGVPTRLVRSGDGTWLLSWASGGVEVVCVAGEENDKPEIITTAAEGWASTVPAALAAGLSELGSTLRVANPWLWDALTTAIMRQVVQAKTARDKYRTWCRTYGSAVDTEHGPQYLAPAPERVLELTDSQFDSVSAAFNRTTLRAAASAYLERGAHWSRLSAAPLVEELMTVERIGPWTAAAAAADFTGDFTHYPHNDLAVRTWAARIAPDQSWPALKNGAFETYWRRLAGRQPGALHTLTLTTLTWGAHARDDQHGGTAARP
ncbi:hypothetical protein [Kitasatospora sp. NPDC088783]|uniref:hypothetical protein n=1 Tax=Kitasatospora sp. NPDC088783 TaxID=3364077 RepID=UPI00380814ED